MFKMLFFMVFRKKKLIFFISELEEPYLEPEPVLERTGTQLRILYIV